jgi:hypothetical protein
MPKPKKRRLDPNRFQKPDEQKFLTFDMPRIRVFVWGIIAGIIGGIFALKADIAWTVVGVLIMVTLSNHHINFASRTIPRWHAVIYSFVGLMLGLVTTATIGAITISYLGWGAAAS